MQFNFRKLTIIFLSLIVLFSVGCGISPTLFAGNKGTGYIDGIGINARFYNPYDMAIDSKSNLYVNDSANNRIRKITPEGVVSTIAGNGKEGYKDGKGEEAEFNTPSGITIDTFNNLYISDARNARIRKITPEGIVSTFAGNGKSEGYKDGKGDEAEFRLPISITIDKNNNLYLVDNGTALIRKISPEGIVSTFKDKSGNIYKLNSSTVASSGIVINKAGQIFICYQDDHNTRYLKKITPENSETIISNYPKIGPIFPEAIAIDDKDNIYTVGVGGTPNDPKDLIVGIIRISPDGKTSLIATGTSGNPVNQLVFDNYRKIIYVSNGTDSIYKYQL